MLAAMGGVIGVVLLDETVVGVALPTIREELGISQLAAHWVINAYLLVFAGLAAAGGKLGDIFGERMPFLVSLALFGLASVACGFAESGNWLIAARALQGVGAAIIFPLSIAIVAIEFPPEQRGAALGIYGAIGTVFLALGPLLGGFFTDVLSWRWIFWINPPIVIAIALVVVVGWRDPPRQETSDRFDLAGLLTLIGGLFAIVLALMQGPEWGWSYPATLALLVSGGALLFAFIATERRSTNPLMEIGLFRNASFTVANLAIFTAQFGKISVIVFGAMYLQHTLDMDPLVAGLALMIAVIPAPLLATLSGRMADKYGARPLVLFGLALSGAMLIWLSWALSQETYWLLAPGLILWGVGTTFLFAPPRSAVMNSVPPEEHGQVGGISMTAQLLGGTMGMAISSTLFTTTHSYSVIFIANAALVVVVLALAWRFVERHDQVQKSRQPEPDRGN